MSDLKPKTLLETAIERRDTYQRNLVDEMTNVIFFTKIKNKEKKDSQERVNAIKSIDNAQKGVKNGKLLLESFDEVIEKLKKDTK